MKTKFILIFPILIIFLNIEISAQGVSINLNNAAPDSSAMLDITSADKGVLIPRMTKTQRNLIRNPKEGLLIFQRDETPGLYFYKNEWKNVNLKSSDWLEYAGNVYREFGYVGIGTQLPSKNLTVYDYDQTTGIEVQTNGTSENSFTTLILKTNRAKGWHFIATGSGASPTERDKFSLKYFNGDEWKNPIAFDTLANVGFGTTQPSQKIHVVGNIALTGEVLTIFKNPKNYNSYKIENSLEKLNKIQPVFYTENNQIKSGFLLDDLEKEFPELIIIKNNSKSINYNGFTPILVNAIQEQQTEIEDLKSENQELKNRLEKIENQLEKLTNK